MLQIEQGIIIQYPTQMLVFVCQQDHIRSADLIELNLVEVWGTDWGRTCSNLVQSWID